MTGWDERVLPLARTSAWIESVLPGHRVVGPPGILNTNPWGGVTARFGVVDGDGRRDEVVLKVSTLPALRHGGRLGALLARRCPGLVPDVLAWAADEDRGLTLSRVFRGVEVRRLDALEPTLGMARTLARVQAAMADAPPDEWRDMPRMPMSEIPGLLDGLIADVEDRFWGWWREAGDDERIAVPPNLTERLAAHRPRLEEWARELAGGPVPESIDHVDLLPHNAVVQEDGSVLVYDWEQAEWSCPLFSLDYLLFYAQQIGRRPAGYDLEPERATAETAAVRRAYLDTLPWGSPAERERAFDLAMRLAPIRYAWTEQRMALRFDQERGWADDMAWWLTRALRRWEAAAPD